MDFWEAMKRLDEGPMTAERDFDLAVNRNAAALKQEHDIRFDPNAPVNLDTAMADRLFEAAVRFFVQVGVYCPDTRTVARFTERELSRALDGAPGEVGFGEGAGRRYLRHRKVEDGRPPFCSPNPVGTPVREELFAAVLKSYAQVRRADTFSGPSLVSLYGRPVRSGTPLEVEAAIWNIEKIHEARQSAGRPDMGCHNFISCAEKTDAIIAAACSGFGARTTDGLLNGAIAEMKVDFERLKKVAFLRRSGQVIGGLYGPLMGGYAGGPEETAIVLVAHHFLGLLLFQATWHDSFPIHLHQVCNTGRKLLWLMTIAGQSIARNCALPVATCCFAAAGPCTPMIFDELAAHTVSAVVSGYGINPMAPARNKHPERCSGFEASACCDIGHAVAGSGMGLADANEFVRRLMEGYEQRIPHAPIGKTFSECYDVERVRPGEEYTRLYEEVKKKWEGMGFPVERLPGAGG
jgi:methylamine--corrinoid protein Co-methyltransferase